MKEGDGGVRCFGTNKQWENNFGPPWKTRGKLKGGGRVMGRCAFSRTATRRERKSMGVIGMLGQR